LGKTSELAKIVKENGITHVFIANSELDNEELFNIVEKFEGTGVTFSLLTNIFEMLKNNRDVHVIGTLPIIEISHGELSEVFEVCKRIFDIAFSLAILLLFLPLGILIALGIKLDSRGPIFIAQKRIGLHGQPFPMLKFRSMHASTNLYEHAPKHKTDPRITRVGKSLRQFSLDELPQFINVLRGEMSVVGPRPEMEFIVETYRPWQKKRLSIRPGITGLWQILGRKNLPLHANLEYDFYYIKNRSFALDLSILIKTIPVVLIRRGAF
jgi:exopolysaccharide biosynthesis polyprenyl glycosylphosphotransferase